MVMVDERIPIDDVLTGNVKVTYEQMRHEWIGNNGKKDYLIDAELVEHLTDTFACIIVGSVIHWYRKSGIYEPDITGVITRTLIRQHLPRQFQKASVLDQVYRLLMSYASIVVDAEETNRYPDSYAVFQNGIFDIDRWLAVPLKPKHRVIGNQIPHIYKGEEVPEEYGKEFEVFISQSLSSEDRLTLLEFIGLCMTRYTRFEKFMMLSGTGGSGKSTIIALVKAIVGVQNTSSLSIQQLQMQFHRVQLIGKLLNYSGDLNADRLDMTGDLKKLVSGETISDSHKGKPVFSFSSHAKHLFATNEPPVVNDTSTGFYRRLILITMDNVPETPDTELLNKLTTPKSLEYIIDQSIRAYAAAVKRGAMTQSEQSRQAVERYRNDNDSVQGFLAESIVKTDSDSDHIDRQIMFDRYGSYCEEMEIKRRRSYKEFNRILRLKGFEEGKSSGERFWKKCRERTSEDDEKEEQRADRASESARRSAREVPVDMSTFEIIPENVSTPFE